MSWPHGTAGGSEMTTLSELRDAYYATTNRKGTVILTKPTWRRPFLTGQAEDSASGISTGGVLLAAASLLLLALAIAMGITSFHAQYAYIFAAKRQHIASALEALGLDCGAVIFSLLGIALARLGRRAVVERTLVVLCALGSCGMNALNANLGSPRSVAVYAMPPVLFALTSDRLVSVIRRAALGPAEDSDDQRSAWRLAGRAALYALRCWPHRTEPRRHDRDVRHRAPGGRAAARRRAVGVPAVVPAAALAGPRDAAAAAAQAPPGPRPRHRARALAALGPFRRVAPVGAVAPVAVCLAAAPRGGAQCVRRPGAPAARAAFPGGGARRHHRAAAHLQDRIPGRRDPALPGPGPEHHDQ